MLLFKCIQNGLCLMCFFRVGLDGISDWSDLLCDPLNQRVAWFNSPRDLLGLSLKSLGLSYNTGISEIRKIKDSGDMTMEERARKRVREFKDNSLVFSNT